MRESYKEIFTLTVPANKPISGAPVGPMIGQRGLSLNEFSNEVIRSTSIIEDDVPCTLSINVLKNKKFTINLKKVPISYIIRSVITTNQYRENEIDIRAIYAITRILGEQKSYGQDNDFIYKNIFKQLISSIKSHKFKIKL